MEESPAVRTYFLKERQNKSYNIDKLIEEQMPVRKLLSKGTRKSLPSKQTKQAFHNQYTVRFHKKLTNYYNWCIFTN